MKHSKARNVIERAFEVLKMRWAILKSRSFYPIDFQNCIIMACILLHNFVRMEMPDDPLENEIPEDYEQANPQNEDYISIVESSDQWSAWRDNLAMTMYNEWRARL